MLIGKALLPAESRLQDVVRSVTLTGMTFLYLRWKKFVRLSTPSPVHWVVTTKTDVCIATTLQVTDTVDLANPVTSNMLYVPLLSLVR